MRRLIPMAALLLVLASVSNAGAVTCASGWTLMTTQNPSATGDRFLGVDGVSSTDAWAVGSQRVGVVNNTLAEHWDGSAWSLFATPNPGGGTNYNDLSDVFVRTSTDAWAVGNYSPDGVITNSLIIRWNGATWTQVPSPTPGDTETNLNGITAISATDAWAVGSYDSGVSFKTLILHWDGANWTQFPSPNPGTSTNGLNDVSALSSTNVWAAGGQRSGGDSRSLVEHWNGSHWKVVTSPNYGPDQNSVLALDAISSKNVWVVGFHQSAALFFRPILLHWNGTKFSKFTSTLIGTDDNLVYGLDHVGAKEVWAVGTVRVGTPPYGTLVLRWNGKTWKASTAQNPGDSSNAFLDVFAEAHNTLLAAGSSSAPANALAETKCP